MTDLHHHAGNLYGCPACPKCGGTHRYPTQRTHPEHPNAILCECDYVERLSEEQIQEMIADDANYGSIERRPRRVLVLDDEAYRVRFLREQLPGALVHHADGAAEFLRRKADWATYDVVVLDHDLGTRETGLDVARAIPRDFPVPVVVWSYNPAGAQRMVQVLREKRVACVYAPFGPTAIHEIRCSRRPPPTPLPQPEPIDFQWELAEVQLRCVDVLGKAGRIDLLVDLVSGLMGEGADDDMSIQAAHSWLCGLNLVRTAGDDTEETKALRARLVTYLENRARRFGRDPEQLVGDLR